MERIAAVEGRTVREILQKCMNRYREGGFDEAQLNTDIEMLELYPRHIPHYVQVWLERTGRIKKPYMNGAIVHL